MQIDVSRTSAFIILFKTAAVAGAGLTVAGTYVLRWVRGPGHSKRRDFERGYRKGLTDSVHNFSRELIAEGLKPPANYLCGRPIPTKYPSRRGGARRGSVGGVDGGVEGISIFRAPDLLFARPTGTTTCRGHSGRNTERGTCNCFEYIIS